jgi:hypothetical protein
LNESFEARECYEDLFKFDWVSHPDKEIRNWVKKMNRLINGGMPYWNVKSSKIKKVVIIWVEKYNK